jgi:hypothetical protein
MASCAATALSIQSSNCALTAGPMNDNSGRESIRKLQTVMCARILSARLSV